MFKLTMDYFFELMNCYSSHQYQRNSQLEIEDPIHVATEKSAPYHSYIIFLYVCPQYVRSLMIKNST